jgi:hypothetical protein
LEFVLVVSNKHLVQEACHLLKVSRGMSFEIYRVTLFIEISRSPTAALVLCYLNYARGSALYAQDAGNSVADLPSMMVQAIT